MKAEEKQYRMLLNREGMKTENSLVSSWGFGPKSIGFLQTEFLLTLSVAWILFQVL